MCGDPEAPAGYLGHPAALSLFSTATTRHSLHCLLRWLWALRLRGDQMGPRPSSIAPPVPCSSADLQEPLGVCTNQIKVHGQTFNLVLITLSGSQSPFPVVKQGFCSGQEI